MSERCPHTLVPHDYSADIETHSYVVHRNVHSHVAVCRGVHSHVLCRGTHSHVMYRGRHSYSSRLGGGANELAKSPCGEIQQFSPSPRLKKNSR